VLPRLDAVLEKLGTAAAKAAEPARQVFVDLRDRVRALRCWATTQRNTCAWVSGVYAFLESDDDAERERLRSGLQEMIDLDLENTRELLDLWESSDTEFILVSDVGETSFIFGDNMSDLLERKIELTELYRDREPFIDRDIMWRID
jgi:phosphoglycolate phosphatase-like HAD superfamily hydrolase